MDKIIVFTLNSIKTGMRFAFHLNNIKNSNVIWKCFIQNVKQIELKFLFNISMKKKLTCMYMCIGSAATYNRDECLKDFRKRLLNNILHTFNARLFLPTTKILALVGDVKEIPHFSATILRKF